MPEPVPPTEETPGQHCARWLKSAKVKAKETNTVLSWEEVAKIIDHTLTGLAHFKKAPQSDSKAISSEVSISEDIYAAYPRKVGRKAAIEAIKRAIKRLSSKHAHSNVGEQEAGNMLMLAVKDYSKAVSKWPADERNFCPHPATWFNQGRYDDDPKEWVRGKPPTEARDYSKL